jgi:hypothetical protein
MKFRYRTELGFHFSSRNSSNSCSVILLEYNTFNAWCVNESLLIESNPAGIHEATPASAWCNGVLDEFR